MKQMIGLLALVFVGACVSQPSTTSTEQHSDNTCVSDPLAPDGDLVAQCRGWQPVDGVAYLNDFVASTYGDVHSFDLECQAYSNGNLSWCVVVVIFGGTYINISCTYPPDGSKPDCMSTNI